jgi:large-conductance mechanosensitive channel
MAQEQPHPTERHKKAEHKKRRIKEVKTKLSNLTPAAAAEAVEEVMATQARKQVNGFTDFLREQSVVGVGIGLVFGIQIKAVVDTIMASLVNPATQLMLPGGEGLAKQAVKLSYNGKSVELGWGAVVYSLLTFIIVAAIIYAAYKGLKLDRLKKKDK